MKLTRTVLGTTAAIGATHLAASAAAHKLSEGTDPYQLEELLHPVPGSSALITREDGTNLHTTSAGSGPPILFAHGYGLTSREFNLLAERLVAEGRRVITFDQRGHGRSTIGSDGVGSSAMAEDYAAVVKHYDLSDAVLVGHSTGGFLALQFLLDHPAHSDRFRGLLLMASAAGEVADQAPQNRVHAPLLKSGLLPALAGTHTYGTLLASSVTGRRSPATLEAFRSMYAAQNHAAISDVWEMLVEESNYGRLAAISVPTRVICGTADLTTPPHHSERMVAEIPGALLTWVDGAGHMLNWEAVDEVLAEIRAFSPIDA